MRASALWWSHAGTAAQEREGEDRMDFVAVVDQVITLLRQRAA